MQRHILGLILFGSLAACTSEWDPQRASSSADARAEGKQTAAALPGLPRSSFATLPDRGELLAYDRDGDVRKRGAYTSHPVDLSEEHAFNATHDGGEMVITTPNGELLRLEYDRHVEHPDGNWTWIGRAADGAEAVLTFGEKAVFGTISRGLEESIRLTTSGGRAWLVTTDRSKMGDINRAVTRSGEPDYLIPPTVAASLASPASGMSAKADQMMPKASAANTIDVVLGFTNGYAAQVGGASQASTRLNNLIVTANQALTNSQITPRFRLVRTVQVNYPDATANSTALEELTGYRGSGSIPVPAALQPLRTARDQYGGDLVSLVRAFRTPQNDGCGIAWLIGARQTSIVAADAPFGYSVVSDGDDLDEGDNTTYFCREETLAHEMAHNLGQVHDSQNSDEAGVHPYSYGYREASSSGFYTVMAYRLADSDQVAIRNFANPNVRAFNRPTGVANASDNARSMNQTMPIVATFRARVVPALVVRIDINSNDRSDLLWRNTNGRLAYWLMNGASIAYASPSIEQGTGWTLVGSGDFDGIGRAELVWQSASSIVMWRNTGTGNNAAFVPQTIAARPSGWSIIGTADMDGDGKQDLLWRNDATGNFAYWLMNGATIRSMSPSAPVSKSYTLVAIGDFNGDGRSELVWDNNVSIWMWRTSGSGFAQVRVGNHPVGWAIQGAGDISGDGKADLMWRQTASGRFSYWVMNGSTVTSTPPAVPVATAYRLAAYGDLNGDGRTDLVWDNNTSIWAWLAQSTASNFAQTRIGEHPAGWTLQNPPGT